MYISQIKGTYSQMLMVPGNITMRYHHSFMSHHHHVLNLKLQMGSKIPSVKSFSIASLNFLCVIENIFFLISTKLQQKQNIYVCIIKMQSTSLHPISTKSLVSTCTSYPSYPTLIYSILFYHFLTHYKIVNNKNISSSCI